MKKEEIEKIVLDVMKASARVGYNKSNTEIQMFVEQYCNNPKDLPIKLMTKIADMRMEEKDFDWDLFKHYIETNQPSKG